MLNIGRENTTKNEERRKSLKKALRLPLGHLQTLKYTDIDANEEFKKIMIEKYRNKKLTQESFVNALHMKGGNFNLPKDGDYKKEYRKLLEKKYAEKQNS